MAAEDQPSNKELVQHELEDLPEGKAEAVLHHIRQLKHTPDNGAASHAPVDANTPVPHTWKCTRCGATIPRTAQAPDRCPNCGAPREELGLQHEP